MFKKSLHLFKLWGIPVQIHISWLIILVLVTWSFATGFYSESYPGEFSNTQLWVMAFLASLLLFLSILLHEFSHSLVAKKNGLPIGKITLFMFGGVAHMDNEVEDPVVELKMASAGPAMTLILAALFYLLSLALRSVRAASVLFESLVYINIVIFFFNMVPGFPLDGGRILRAIIWYRKKNIVRATDIASRIGKYFALFLIGLGLFSLIFYGNIIGGIWLMIIGTFLRHAAMRSYGAILYDQVMKRLDISDLIRRDAVTVELTTDLDTLVRDYFERYHYFFFPVVTDGRLLGIVSINDVKNADPEKRPGLEVKDIINTRLSEYAIGLSSSPARVFHLINSGRFQSYPVVDHEGTFLGLITRSDFEEAIRVMMSMNN